MDRSADSDHHDVVFSQLDESLLTLYEAINQDASFEEKARDALEIGRQYLGVENGHLTRIDRQTDHWEALASTDSVDGALPAGTTLELETTYCRHLDNSRQELTISDAEVDGWADDRAFIEHGYPYYLGRVLRIEGSPFGTVCFVDGHPRERGFRDDELIFSELITRMLERELERERYERQLRRQTTVASVLNRVLRHNLRNDMVVLQGHTELLASQVEDATSARAITETIQGLLELSDKARELDRILDVENEPDMVDIETVVESISERIQSRHPSTEITIDSSGSADVGIYPSFDRAIEELLTNAVIHTTESASISVTIDTVPNEVHVGIRDDGPGIPAEEVEILDADGESPLFHGSGLGLWLVHWIATSHGGSFSITDTGDGTAASISIPRLHGSVG